MKQLALIFISVLLMHNASSQDHKNVLESDAYLNPPEYILKPSESSFDCHKIENRKFTGISSMAITKNGRMFAFRYASIEPKEDHNNYVVVAQSDDKGETWELRGVARVPKKKHVNLRKT